MSYKAAQKLRIVSAGNAFDVITIMNVWKLAKMISKSVKSSVALKTFYSGKHNDNVFNYVALVKLDLVHIFNALINLVAAVVGLP